MQASRRAAQPDFRPGTVTVKDGAAVSENLKSMAEFVSNASGYDIILYDGSKAQTAANVRSSTDGGRVQGYNSASKGEIGIDISNGNAVATALHEIVHFTAVNAPDNFSAVKNELMRYLAKTGKLDMYLKKYGRRYGANTATIGDITEEMTADAAESLINSAEFVKEVFGDRDFINSLADKRPSIVKQLLSKLKDVIRTIRDFLSGQNVNHEIARTLSGDLEELERIAGLYSDAFKAAIRARREKHEGKPAERTENKNTAVSEDKGGVKYSRAEDNENSTIKEQIAANKTELETMPPLQSSRPYRAFKDSKEALEWAVDVLKSSGDKISRKGFGDVIVDKTRLKNGLGYLKTDAEIIAYSLIPKVIKNGIEIGTHENHKGRNYKTVTFAARISVSGINGNMAVVVRIEGKNYYKLHRVFMPDGGAFEFETKNRSVTETAGGQNMPGLSRTGSASTNDILSHTDEDVKEKFSLSENIEQTKDLVAVHNLDDRKLRGILELGGFPMPSIAITKDTVLHDGYGDISVIFGKDTVDPAADSRNAVYSADAYTARFPDTDYRYNESEIKKIAEKLGKSEASLTSNHFDGRGKDDIIRSLKYDDDTRKIFLDELGIKVQPVMHMPQALTPAHKKPNVERFIARDDITFDRLVHDKGTRASYLDAVRKAYEGTKYAEKWPDKINAKLDECAGSVYVYETEEKRFNTDRAIARSEAEPVEDEYSTSEGINNAVQEHSDDYDMWLDELVSPAMGKQYIRNGKERFTPSGKSRTFEQLHEEYTLENIVRNMKEGSNTESGIFGISGLGEARAAAAHKFSDIDDIKSGEDKISRLSDDELEEIYGKAEDMLDDVCKELASYSPDLDEWEAHDAAAAEITRAIKNYATTAGMKKYLKQFFPGVKDGTVKKITELREALSDLPVKYFEAKPKRAVGFDEVRAVVLPRGTDTGLVNALRENGMKVIEYDADASGDRLAKVNEAADSADDVRFSREEGTDDITVSDVETLREIGRKSVNDFTSEDIQRSEKWARKFYKELGVKSPFFRAWFGDWRAYDKSDVSPVIKTGELRGKVNNNDTGWDINVSRKIHKETSHQSSNLIKNAVKYLPYIKDITENAVLFDSEISDKDNGTSMFFHTMYAYTKALGYPALLKLRVEELYDEDADNSIKRDYILQEIKEETIAGCKQDSTLHHTDDASSVKIISDLYSLVKSYDKNFSPKPANPDMLNEDGTAKIFYHGTKADFTIFDNTKNTDARFSDESVANWFSDNERTAKSYRLGGKTMKTYLSLKNPLIVNCKGKWHYNVEYRSSRGTEKIARMAKRRGYDGVVFCNIRDNSAIYGDIGTSDVVAVFSPEQIKSATDNIGTFDKSNADIRYSISEPDADKIRLAAKNEELENRVKYLKEQMKITKGHKVQRKAVEKLAKTLKADYQSDIDVTGLADMLEEAFNYTASDDSTAYAAHELMNRIADRILSRSKAVDNTLYEQYKDDIKLIRDTKIRVSDGMADEIAFIYGSYEGFRRANFGRLSLSRKEGGSIDALWQELAAHNPYFDEEFISEKDMLPRIAEFLDMTRPQYENPYAEDYDAAKNQLSSEIYDKYFETPEIKTFADKQAAKLQRLVNDNRKRMAAQREKSRAEYEKRLEKVKEANERKIRRLNERINAPEDGNAEQKAALYKKIGELKSRNNEKLMRQQARYQDMARRKSERLRENAAAARYREHIKKTAKSLIRDMSASTVKHHVPEKLRETIARALTSIDFVSEAQKNYAEKNGESAEMRYWDDAFARLKSEIREYEDARSGNIASNDYAGDFDIEFDPNLLSDISDFIAANNGIKRLSDMDAGQLKALSELVDRLRHAVNAANALFTDRTAQTAAQLGRKTIEHLERHAQKKQHGKMLSGADKLLNMDMLDAPSYFRQFGEAGELMYAGLLDGFERRAACLREADAFKETVLKEIKKKTLNEWTGDKAKVYEFKLGGGTLRLTSAQIMTLYELWKREQAKLHITVGGVISKRGIRQNKFAEKAQDRKEWAARHIKQVVPVRIAEHELPQIFGVLTKEQIEIADAMEKFLSETCSKWGNEVSMKMYGYRAFKEKDYMPLSSNRNETRTLEDPKAANTGLFALKNLGFTKATVAGANNSIYLDDIFRVFSRHVADMATYNGYTAPLADIMKWFNFKDKGFGNDPVLYSYERLSSKPDMPIPDVGKISIPVKSDGKTDRTAVIKQSLENIRKAGNQMNTDDKVFLYNKDLDKNVKITDQSIRHGLKRKSENNAVASLALDKYFKNAICVNELKARDGTNGSYVLLGTFLSGDKSYLVRMVVSENSDVIEAEDVDVLYAINAKTEPAANSRPGLLSKNTDHPVTGSAISISDFLKIVKTHFPDILSDDVLSYYGINRPQSSLSDSIKRGAYETKTVNGAMERAYGDDAKQYLIKLIQDINGERNVSDGSGFAETMLKNSKVASVAANVRVAIQQPTASIKTVSRARREEEIPRSRGTLPRRILLSFDPLREVFIFTVI